MTHLRVTAAADIPAAEAHEVAQRAARHWQTETGLGNPLPTPATITHGDLTTTTTQTANGWAVEVSRGDATP